MSNDLCVCGHPGSAHYAIETWQSCCNGDDGKCSCECLDYDGSKSSVEHLYTEIARLREACLKASTAAGDERIQNNLLKAEIARLREERDAALATIERVRYCPAQFASSIKDKAITLVVTTEVLARALAPEASNEVR
jgi:hypothetical protein